MGLAYDQEQLSLKSLFLGRGTRALSDSSLVWPMIEEKVDLMGHLVSLEKCIKCFSRDQQYFTSTSQHVFLRLAVTNLFSTGAFKYS